MQQIMKIKAAASTEEVWEKIEEIEECAKLYTELHKEKKGIREDLQAVTLWRVLTPGAEALLNLQIHELEYMSYERLKSEVTSWLQTASEGRVGM